MTFKKIVPPLKSPPARLCSFIKLNSRLLLIVSTQQHVISVSTCRVNTSRLSVSRPAELCASASGRSKAKVTPPGTQRLWFPGCCPAGHGNNAAGSLVGIVYGRNYDGIWLSSNLRLSFLINENILDTCFRPSCAGPRMSPLAAQSECPRPSLSSWPQFMKKTHSQFASPAAKGRLEGL